MAKKRNTDFFDALRGAGLRKRVARALTDIDASSKGARGNAEKAARRVIGDLRSAADSIEKRLDIGGAGTRSAAGKKAARTRKRSSAKRSAAAKRGAASRTRKSAAGKAPVKRATRAVRKAAGGARKAAPRKTTARKSTARKRATKRS